MNHRTTMLAITTALTILTTACEEPEPGTGPSAPAPSATGAPANAGKAPSYTLPDDICSIADPSGFQDLYPGTTPKFNAADVPIKATSGAGVCTVMLGGLESAIGLSVGAEVFTRPDNAREQYDFLRKRVFADYPDAANIGGLGDGAYTFTDDTFHGLRVVVLHGNAHNSIVITKHGKATYPTDTQQRLIAMAKKMLAAMPKT